MGSKSNGLKIKWVNERKRDSPQLISNSAKCSYPPRKTGYLDSFENGAQRASRGSKRSTFRPADSVAANFVWIPLSAWRVKRFHRNVLRTVGDWRWTAGIFFCYTVARSGQRNSNSSLGASLQGENGPGRTATLHPPALGKCSLHPEKRSMAHFGFEGRSI
jgi:hypothetical protein